MQITADVRKMLKNVPRDLIFDARSELLIDFISFLVVLAVENVVIFTKKSFFIENESA